jgi:filamentous hemagglutinin family protein
MSNWHLNTWVLIGSALWGLGYVQPIAAQVVPDTTLPTGERSQVTGNPNFQIDGGARRGGNLFHSFSQFSIPTGGSASFNNAPTILNIFARITGNSLSNIEGLIRSNGTANLFLLNSNGILFGSNASLNMGGSFVATTASAIGFPNGEVFSSDATQPLPSQLLTVNPNAFFFSQLTPQPIVNRSTLDGTGLQVPLKQNLLLVGGSVQLDNGRIASPGSYVELGSVGGIGTVGLVTTPEDWQLNIPNNVARADVFLSNNSRINVLAGEGGSIAIAARNVFLNQESRLRVGIDGESGFTGAQTGGIQIDATEAVNLASRATIRTEVLSGGKGNVGNMTITAGSLSLTENARLIAVTTGEGNVGSVNINARDTVFLDGSSIFGGVQNNAIGNTGGINITTGSLSLVGGAQLLSSGRGRGNAGSVNIRARDTVLVEGEDPSGAFASTIFTQVNPGALGQGGDVTILTGTLFLTNGGAVNTANTGGVGNAGRVTIQARDSVQIRGTAPLLTDNRSGVFTSATEGSVGSGGDVSITTGSLSVSDQGRIITNAEGQGNAGNIQIQARDAIVFEGGDAISTLSPGAVGRGGDINITARSLSLLNGSQLSAATAGAGNAGNISMTTLEFASFSGVNSSGRSSGLLTTTEPSATGSGGEIRLSTGTLQITNGAEVTVSSSSLGRAGSVFLNANQISLNNQGSLRADTSGGGGNISLRSPLLLLRRGSNITTNATGSDIPGGNIAIETRFLVAAPNEDSNISANSEDFRGGNVGIKAFSIYGIQPRLSPTRLSDITATGATLALSGTIEVTTADLDPTSGLVALPTDLVDSSRLIAQGCPANQGNSFVITGRGGIAPTPEQQLDDDADWQDRRRLVATQTHPEKNDRSQQSANRSHASSTHPQIIEATGWRITPTGQVILVATLPDSTVQNPFNQPVACNERR